MMFAAECVLAFPMPSDSGRAVMSLPIAIPLADLLGLSRQMVVHAYQYSSVASGIVTPTTGAFLAMLAIAQVPCTAWLRFVAIPFALLTEFSIAAMIIGVRVGIR
jgi:uncharacterized ion transporter superfamily protein YfcC